MLLPCLGIEVLAHKVVKAVVVMYPQMVFSNVCRPLEKPRFFRLPLRVEVAGHQGPEEESILIVLFWV